MAFAAAKVWRVVAARAPAIMPGMSPAGLELVPPRDELGLPGWPWVFQLLLPVTFALHVVFMNYALGASLVAPLFWCAGLRRRREDYVTLARTMVRVWPVAISLTITTGVAPLLFVQALYGHVFYTANILAGWAWLAILLYLLVGFYLVYALDRAMERRQIWRGALMMVLIAAAFLMIAHEFTNNSVLKLMPEAWRDIHEGRAGRHAPHAMWIPRNLHTVIGSLAVTGLWVAGLGRWSRALSGTARRLAVSAGLRLALGATALQVLTGLWFFAVLDADVQRAMLDFGTVRAWLWALAVLGGLGLLAALWRATERPDAPSSIWLPGALLGFVLVGMAAGRETVRMAMLARIPGALYTSADTRMQGGALAMFVFTLVLGLIAVTVLVRWGRRPASGSTPDVSP